MAASLRWTSVSTQPIRFVFQPTLSVLLFSLLRLRQYCCSCDFRGRHYLTATHLSVLCLYTGHSCDLGRLSEVDQ